MVKTLNEIKWFHRIKLPDGSYTPGSVNHGPDGGDWPTTRYGLPDTLVGKTVLDIGCYDGFFSFEAEKRGGGVMAVDRWMSDGFKYAREALSSQVSFQTYNLDTEDLAHRYDVVLCYGVLYHLKSPLMAIERLFNLTKVDGVCLIETAISDKNDYPMLEYKPGIEDDPTNFFYPNHKWLELAGKQAGFTSSELVWTDGHRSTFRFKKGKRFDYEVARKNTLVNKPRLDVIIQKLYQTKDLPGDVAEVGVYKGGSAYTICHHTSKHVYLFDTFEGMPEVSSKDNHHKKGDFSDTSVDKVKELLKGFETKAAVIQGVFPQDKGYLVEDETFSFVHLDVDIYTSVRDCLGFFYPRMSPGGVILLDDYNEPCCLGAKQAADEFFQDKPEKVLPTVESQGIIVKL